MLFGDKQLFDVFYVSLRLLALDGEFKDAEWGILFFGKGSGEIEALVRGLRLWIMQFSFFFLSCHHIHPPFLRSKIPSLSFLSFSKL